MLHPQTLGKVERTRADLPPMSQASSMGLQVGDAVVALINRGIPSDRASRSLAYLISHGDLQLDGRRRVTTKTAPRAA